MRSLIIVVVAVVLAAAAGRADAYPQFQLVRDQTCSSCHISPAGGGLLTEMGMITAEDISMLGTNPAFLNGAVETPAWLRLGGDFRAMGGWLHAPQDYLWLFPMQADLYGAATKDNFSLIATVGLRPAQEGNEAATRVWARELYAMWQSEAGGSEGLFVRAGQLMPVFGLRLVEHHAYIRRYGGTPLFAESPAASVSYVKQRLEAHLTGFVESPIIDPVRLASGAAAYVQMRVDDKTALGAGGMYEHFNSDRYTLRGAITAKRAITDKLLVLGELQLVNPHVDPYGWTQIVSYLGASYFLPKGLMVDVAWNHFDENLRVSKLDRDAIDVNLHWFATSHVELLWVNRYEMIGLGDGGPSGAMSMLQGHYRL